MNRVLHLVEHLYEGGIERLLEQLAKHTPRERHALYFFTYQTSELRGIGLKLREHGLPVYCYDKPKGYDFSLFKRLCRVIQENQIDVLHTHDFGPMEYALPLRVRFPRLKLIHTQHTLHDFLPHRKYRYFFQVASLAYAKIIGVSPYVTEQLATYCGFSRSKLRTIFNGLNVEAFSQPRLSTTEHGQTLRLVNVSRISEEKNLLHLLRACQRLKASNISFTLHHAGSGSPEAESTVRNFIRANALEGVVHLHGFQENVPEILGLGDIFVSASTTEGHPVAVLEAMASGLLCLCSDIPAHRLLSDDGLLFFSLDDDSLFHRLREIHEHPTRYEKVAATGKATVTNRFSLDTMIRSYGGAYA